MNFKTDFENVGNESGGFTPITPGEYEVFPTAYDITRSEKGNEMVTFNYVIRDDVDQDFKGREVRFDRFVITEKAMWRINQASKCANLDGDKDYADAKEWAEDFKGQAIRIYVGEKEYNGKTYAEVKSFMESQSPGEMETPGGLNISDDDLPF